MSYHITEANSLIRRVPELPSHVEQDGAGAFIRDAAGRPQLTSTVFKYSPKGAGDGVSVDVLEIWLGLVPYEQALARAAFNLVTRTGAGHLAAILPAVVPLGLGLLCVHDPVAETEDLPANPAHALIQGEITKSLARRLAKACQLVERPNTASALV
ncbi:hypothetical protein [Hymenobacter sp.]|uniref:hypothetical protein n=1 Tax=Hymenobacter sp. TaxID=1898978 RepID=UPI00286BD8B7|nr:hypothetical protein [Hymenobacter sp.]